MRFVILIALLGIAAASCPNNFNQRLQGNQHHQQNDLYNEDDDSDYYQSQHHQNQYQQDDDQDDEDDQDQLGGRNNRHHQDEDDEDQLNRHHQSGYRQGGQHQGGHHQNQHNSQLLHHLEQPNAHLAAKLYKQAKQQQDDKNTVVSPAAVQLTLAALHKGAKGNTKEQIKRSQCPHLSHQQCHHAHAALIRSLKGSNNVQQTQKPGQHSNSHQNAKINVATAIIINQQTHAQQHFVQAVQQGLGGQVQHCSFKHQHQQCRQHVNHLVSAKTNHKIQNIIPQHAVTGNTKMIAVSALHLQAKWGHQFQQHQTTKQGRFHPLGSQHSKHVQVIQSQGRFHYYEDNQVQVVGIPTQNQELTLYVILPQEQDGLTHVEKEQVHNGQQLKELLDNCDQQKHHVQVQLPKFQITHKLDAKQTLSQQQGVQDAFDHDHADFSGISGQHQQQNPTTKIHLNKLIHQATIKINEHGISSANTGSQQEQIHHSQDQDDQDNEYGSHHQSQQHHQGQNQLIADHAFAFVVKHNPSNQIVLVGRVIDATQKPQGHHQSHHQFHQGSNQE